MNLTLFVLAALVSFALGYDLRTVQCTPFFGKWPCWYAQTCGDVLYVCKGDAPNAPPFTAVAFGWIIFGGAMATLVGIGLVIAAIVFAVIGGQRLRSWCKAWGPCCK
jgi:hypothetical protein